MIKVGVVGAAGRMGRNIIASIDDTEGVELGGGTESAGHPDLGRDLGELAGLAKKNVALTDDVNALVDACDVIIDFTLPEVSMATLKAVAAKNKAVVFGTTGFSAGQKREIEQAAKSIRCVLAPNMSIGVNVLFKIAGEVARVLGDAYDVEIVEAHHKFKKDAPSGTAVRISEIVADALERNLDEVGVYGRKGFSDGRGEKEIGVHTLRAGDIIGEHRVMFGGMGETLELSHRAQSRQTFARGSVRAAQWVVSQPPGLYDMQDVLGLRD
ncbi:4-hydroxy-tetrahydrodipicolinate reductase [Nitrospina gracilis]|uniref:4-hydroxy-tetrahydrodipicolinate reductase n=1 Tax=Nitrospina gracilis TaxID=35801 RepID=UPI0023516D3D|nr:4-hydroxy-tetrahydrodipicolinate reductase [Nitrospina gracilis]MCF8721582.1 4-hydroxy-tetrahydrodipicolinate reductase [Nitrospina gracilis Nb-211]